MNLPRLLRRRPRLRLTEHRSTTRQLASLYPWQVDPGLGVRGIYMGTDLEAGGTTFHYDPFELYDQGVITSPNIVVLGLVGSGKTTFVRNLITRPVGLLRSPDGRPRFAAITDPKGEYGPTADLLHMTHLRLAPASTPSTPDPSTAPSPTSPPDAPP